MVSQSTQILNLEERSERSFGLVQAVRVYCMAALINLFSLKNLGLFGE